MMNNVGVNFYGKVHETSDEDWAACLNLNLGGVYRGMREAIPHLLTAGGGSIVNTASNQGLVAFNGFAPYAAAKGAIVQLTRAMALDYARERIRVNAVCPGWTRSALVEGIFEASGDPARMERVVDGGLLALLEGGAGAGSEQTL
jgi:meso-butanediol dehydrogenase/(S,S)-butanediol dehydrogenase/diacetyl reductase